MLKFRKLIRTILRTEKLDNQIYANSRQKVFRFGQKSQESFLQRCLIYRTNLKIQNDQELNYRRRNEKILLTQNHWKNRSKN